MKKKYIIFIILFVFGLLGISTSIIDNARVNKNIEPIFMIKSVNYDGSKVTYWGFGYKVIRYPSVSPNEPFGSNVGVKFGSWFMSYDKIIDYSKRYDEIKISVKNAVEKNIHAQFPHCSISYNYDKNLKTGGTHYNSSFLINNGYIKASELVDIDNESYCDVFVDIKVKYDNPLDHQNNCEAFYITYLKCKEYEEKGYVNRDK